MCMSVFVYVYMYVYMHVCMLCMYVRMYASTYHLTQLYISEDANLKSAAVTIAMSISAHNPLPITVIYSVI